MSALLQNPSEAQRLGVLAEQGDQQAQSALILMEQQQQIAQQRALEQAGQALSQPMQPAMQSTYQPDGYVGDLPPNVDQQIHDNLQPLSDEEIQGIQRDTRNANMGIAIANAMQNAAYNGVTIGQRPQPFAMQNYQQRVDAEEAKRMSLAKKYLTLRESQRAERGGSSKNGELTAPEKNFRRLTDLTEQFGANSPQVQQFKDVLKMENFSGKLDYQDQLHAMQITKKEKELQLETEAKDRDKRITQGHARFEDLVDEVIPGYETLISGYADIEALIDEGASTGRLRDYQAKVDAKTSELQTVISRMALPMAKPMLGGAFSERELNLLLATVIPMTNPARAKEYAAERRKAIDVLRQQAEIEADILANGGTRQDIWKARRNSAGSNDLKASMEKLRALTEVGDAPKPTRTITR